MERTPRVDVVFGVAVPPEERTPLVEQLLDVIRRLAAEVDRLKGLPQTPKRPNRAPSGLNEDHPPSQDKAKRKRKKKRGHGKRPGSEKRSKTSQLAVTDTKDIIIADVPLGTRIIGCRKYHVQDLRVEAQHICLRRIRYLFPDGTLHTAPLPAGVDGHFGPGLRAHVLYQYYQNHVTQPLILEELREFGIDISVGEVNRLLTEGHDSFHTEKDGLLPAAREVSAYFNTDDTPSRHEGRPAHTHHIGNEFFASFTTTDTKSRVNFLKILCAPYEEYVLSTDSLFYMEYHGMAERTLQRLRAQLSAEGFVIYQNGTEWRERLEAWGVVGDEPERIATEAALWGCLMDRDMYLTQPLLSDDAGQFKLLGFFNGLCWLHAERHVARLVPMDERQNRAWETTRDAIWRYYQRLKTYRDAPTPTRRSRLERDFDRLFLKNTGWPKLNDVLRRLYERRENLLLVLDHPEMPLHNNISESDIREWAKRRKISGSTRSDLGRRCRDTFTSLKKTCRKLGISFWRYLQDRISGLGQITPLPEAIRSAAASTN